MTPPGREKNSIDWAELQRKVDAARQATERGWAPSAEEKKRILRARAQALAAVPAERVAAARTVDVVMFRLADEAYGIELPFVREVYPLKAFTPVPCTPAFVLGIINIRGQILSVIDLGKFFDLPEKGLTDLNKVVVLSRGAMELGILADEVVGVQVIPLDRIQPIPPILAGLRETYLKGVTPERLAVLDGGAILSDRSIVVDEHVEG